MRLDPRGLRVAFRAPVGRIAVGADEVPLARWWRWVEEAAPPAKETCPGLPTFTLWDVLSERGINHHERGIIDSLWDAGTLRLGPGR